MGPSSEGDFVVQVFAGRRKLARHAAVASPGLRRRNGTDVDAFFFRWRISFLIEVMPERQLYLLAQVIFAFPSPSLRQDSGEVAPEIKLITAFEFEHRATVLFI